MTASRHAIALRDARPEDAPVLAAIHRDARAAAMPWLAVVHSAAETDDWMANIILPTQRVRVATIDNAAVGFYAATDGWLEQLYVRPDLRGGGIGSRLFNDVCHIATGPFRLWVFQRNAPARRFYEERGCHVVTMTDGRDNEEREPDVLYERLASVKYPT